MNLVENSLKRIKMEIVFFFSFNCWHLPLIQSLLITQFSSELLKQIVYLSNTLKEKFHKDEDTFTSKCKIFNLKH